METKLDSNISPRLLRVWSLYLWAMLVMTLIRTEHVLWNLQYLKSQPLSDILMSFLYGMRFDMVACGWLIAPLVLFSLIPYPARFDKIWNWFSLTFFLVVNVPFWILNLIDVEFVNFVGRRMTVDVLFILGEAQGKTSGFLSAYGLLLFCSTLMTVVGTVGAILVYRQVNKCSVGRNWGWKRRAALGVFSVLITVVMVRGGVQNKPIHLVNAQIFHYPALNLVILNSSFTILKSVGKKDVRKLHYFASVDRMRPYLDGAAPEPSFLEGKRPTAPQNVVILILESFGREYMGEVNGVKGYTPFLDELSKKSLSFKNGIANGRRSIEGIPAVLSGAPALMNEPFVTSPYSNGDFPGLGTRLKAQGYETSFFHGGKNGTMHFDSYTHSAGMDTYYGQNEYPDSKDNDGVWGIYDGPMLQWMKTKIDGMKQPFAASFFSLSSHNPYLIPKELQSQFPEGPIPILKTVAYTDDSLRKFFAEAEKSEWFKNTLFVITADHTSTPYLPQFEHEIGRYLVPIIFYHPGYEWPKEIDRDQIVQQIDILPSVLDFLGQKDQAPNLLARSVFVPGERSAAVFANDVSILISKENFIYWPAEREPQMYSMNDPQRSKELEEQPTKMILVNRLKASLQYFGDSMMANRWLQE